MFTSYVTSHWPVPTHDCTGVYTFLDYTTLLRNMNCFSLGKKLFHSYNHSTLSNYFNSINKHFKQLQTFSEGFNS